MFDMIDGFVFVGIVAFVEALCVVEVGVMEAFALVEETWITDEFNEFMAFETLAYFEKTVVFVVH